MTGRHQVRALGRDGGADDAAGSAQDGADESAGIDELSLDEDWVEPGDAEAEAEAPEEFELEAELAPHRERSGWLAPTLAILALAGWTGFFVWAMRGEMLAVPTAPPRVWAEWIVQWTVPAGLIGIAWLLNRRSARTEAHRYAASAALLSQESALLETRLKVVNRELSLAREFLAAEARDLEALGRIAAERLSTHAFELQTLITTNGGQVDAISSASDTALGNMSRLRDDLPVIANAARDVANQIGSAGRSAQDQLDQMVAGFAQLEQSGAAAGAQAETFGEQVGTSLASFTAQIAQIEALVTDRFAALERDAEAYRARVETLENEALAALGERARLAAAETEAISARLRESGTAAREALATTIAQLHDQMIEKLQMVDALDSSTSAAALQRLSQLREEAARFEDKLAERDLLFDEAFERRQAQFETREAQASEVLAQRLAAFDDALAQRREAQLADTAQLVAHSEAITAHLGTLGTQLADVAQHGDAARTSLSAGLATLGHQLADKRAALAETEGKLAQLTDSAIRLLEIIQSGTQATREDLPKAIAAAEAALTGVGERADTVSQLMLRSSQQGSTLSDYLVKTRSEIDAADAAIAGLNSQLAQQTSLAVERMQGLRDGFAQLAADSGTLAHDTQERLQGALTMIETAINQAFSTLDSGARERTSALADTIGVEAVQTLERALRNERAAVIGQLEQAASHAAGVGREAAIQLRDQLVRVNELTGNLEQRIARARELAEDQVNNDFARRMALITDSLNSAAIDISGALSTEVADTAWDAYLKGDRGIFTRRAVRLLDSGAVRDIAALYTEDESFKANVNRYIHDFEAMLRAMLSTRDGHVLSVTVLGSDMGKLYVSLAQAIQRLRT